MSGVHHYTNKKHSKSLRYLLLHNSLKKIFTINTQSDIYDCRSSTMQERK